MKLYEILYKILLKFKFLRDNFVAFQIGNFNKIMDRHPQQIKRERQDKHRRERNINNLSRLKTSIKNVLSTKVVKEAEPLYKDTVSFLDKMAQSGLIHKNTAARRKSQITHHYNSISKS